MYIYTTVVAACALASLPSSVPAPAPPTQVVSPVVSVAASTAAPSSVVPVHHGHAQAHQHKETVAPKVEPSKAAEPPKVEPPAYTPPAIQTTLLTSANPTPTLAYAPVVKAAVPAPAESSSSGSGTGGTIHITPHDKYSSSIGVLGCKVNTNRIAYWPSMPGCNDLCYKVSANGRSVNLLHIDTSGGAYDISYDAWNYLSTGSNATASPTAGGPFAATYESVPMSECADILNDGSLPLQAANSMNYYTSCGASTWVGQNAKLWNIQNCACTLGFNEECQLDLSVSNQAKCGHKLGDNSKLEGLPVMDIMYMTGEEVVAVQ